MEWYCNANSLSKYGVQRDAGENITIEFQKKSYHATADANGQWSITLPPLKAGGPFLMQINDIKLNDILVGDVWLCSGQSNMELPVKRVMDIVF